MKTLLTIIVIVVGISFGYSQEYDLIVNTNGDSIACHIDSITDSQIYFEMKINQNWIHTDINKENVTEFKNNVIEWKSYIYKSGTSYILSTIKPINSVRDLPKNSIYTGCNILAVPVIYERTIPIGNKTALLAGCGIIETIGFYFSTSPVAKVGMIYGKNKHLIEGGTYIDLMHQNDNINLFIPVLGYRYQSPRGFLFRADVALIMVGVSIGYSF